MKIRLFIFSLLCFVTARGDVVDNLIVKSNLTTRGTIYYAGDGKNNVVSGVGYALGMRYQTNGTPTLYPTALSVSTIADLAGKVYTDTVTTNSTIEVRGYATEGDGGGGTFYFAPFSATNRIDTFASGSASFVWKRVPPADGVMSPAMAGMFGIQGVGENLLSMADSRMSTNTYSGTTSWSEYANNFAAFAVGGGKMTFTLQGSSAAQSVRLAGTSIRSPGMGDPNARYIVKLKARLVSGTAVPLAIGKSFVTTSMRYAFTPTATETTFTGYFTGGDTTLSLYIGLLTNNTSNGSSYEIDDVEVYYDGSATLTAVPDPANAPDESAQFTALLNYRKGLPNKIAFPPNRIFRVNGGDFVAWDGTQIQLNNSELYFSGINNTAGLRFTSFGSLTGGKIRGQYTASASDKGLIQAGVSQSEASPIGRIVMSDLFINDDTTNTHVSLLVFGSHNAEIKNIEFADTAFTRRQINVVWAGNSTLILGYNPAVNVVIENVYAGNSGQNYPTEGGGCVVGINGIVNCYIRNVYADSVGRSLVDLGTGDWYDTRFAPPALNASLATCVIDNCAVANGNIGFRVDGTAYLSTTKFAPLTVSIRNCFSRSVGGYLGTTYDAGVLVNPSVANVTVKDSMFIGHKHGIQVTNQFVTPTADAFSRDITIENNVIRDSKLTGIYLIGATDTKVLNNHIYNSGVDGFSAYRQAIWVYDYNTNVVVRGNFIGEVNETTTNQTTGIEIRSNARNHAIAVDGNYIYGAAASGTPISYGASATYSLKGLNYVGTALTSVSTASKLSDFAATTSSELAGVISNETGSGSLVFGTSPSISGPTLSGTSLIGGTPTFTAIPRPNADNTIDLGTSAASWKDIYADGDIYAGQSGAFRFGSGRTRLDSSANGFLSIRTASAGNMSRVLFGTADSSGPALSFSGTTIQVTDGAGTRTALEAGSIELGAASDTTIARSAAGVVTIEGNAIITSTTIRSGTGAPEGVVTAPVGTLFLRTDGGAGSTLYVKESGAGNTGWVAK